ncbi:MAG: hypothetical protein ACHP65_09185 [Legionellales bacterium]
MMHQGITSEYWSKFTLMEQLANIGMDVSRTIRWKNKGKHDDSQAAFARAMELLNLSIADPKNQNHRLKELLIVREALMDYFMGNNEYKSTDEAWENYFIYFNWIAATERGR